MVDEASLEKWAMKLLCLVRNGLEKNDWTETPGVNDYKFFLKDFLEEIEVPVENKPGHELSIKSDSIVPEGYIDFVANGKRTRFRIN